MFIFNTYRLVWVKPPRPESGACCTTEILMSQIFSIFLTPLHSKVVFVPHIHLHQK